MRIGVISDTHGNAVALEAVLDAMGPVDTLWCLGDLVGYGAQPNECITAAQRYKLRCLRGNHDLAALGHAPLSLFNREAAAALAWTADALSPDGRAFLEAQPERRVELGKFTLVHGSPREPVWEYLLEPQQALENFPLFDTTLCFLGHTHIPLLFDERGGGGVVKGDYVLTHRSRPFQRLIVNPGSVGQPRDRNPKASFMMVETFPLRLEWRRVAYDIARAQRRILDAGLPPSLAERLGFGV